jgi:hypothetical protein
LLPHEVPNNGAVELRSVWGGSQMMLFEFNGPDLDHPPQEIVEFVQRLIAQYTISSKFLAIRLTDRDGLKLTGAIEVLRCRPVGQFFEVGGKFVTKLYDGLERLLKDH